MKRISYIFAAAMAIISSVACSVDEIDNPSVEKTPLVFTASFDATKANINENGKFSWAAGDKIKVINAEGASEDVALAEADIVDGIATFTVTGLDESETYYAVYPSSNYKSLTDGNLTVGPKTIQAAADQKTCVSVCSAAEMDFCFHNTACLIKFETEINFSQAVITAFGNESIHSTYKVNPTTGEMEAVVGEKGNQVYFNRNGKTGPYFFELAPGVTMASGFTIELRDAEKNVLATYTNTNSITTARNKILNIKNFDSRIDGKYTVTLSDDPENPLASVDGKVTLPTRDGNDTYAFAGWTADEFTSGTATSPEIIEAGSYSPTADITLYPVYSRPVAVGSKWIKKTVSEISEGVYALLTTDGHAFNGTISNGHGQVTSAAFIFTNDIATTAPVETLELTLTAVTGGYTMYNADNGYLYASKAASGGLAWHNSETSYWYYSSSNWTYKNNDAYLREYNNNSIRTYGANNGEVLVFAKKEDVQETRYYTSLPTLVSISVSENHRQFTVGDSFVPETVTANYSDNTTADVTTDAEFTGYDMDATGDQTVTVTYSGETTSYSISVSASVTVYTASGTFASSKTVKTLETGKPITYVSVKGSSSSSDVAEYNNPGRFYAKNEITFSGATIKKIIVNCTSDTYANNCAGSTITVNDGASANASVSGLVVTITITGTTNSVKIVPAAQFRANTAEVTYLAE